MFFMAMCCGLSREQVSRQPPMFDIYKVFKYLSKIFKILSLKEFQNDQVHFPAFSSTSLR